MGLAHEPGVRFHFRALASMLNPARPVVVAAHCPYAYAGGGGGHGADRNRQLIERS
jgi:hypothetical protein